MPDPQKTLAPIIGPTPPPVVADTALAWPAILPATLFLLLAVALTHWLWRRQTPRRALHRIVRQYARQPDTSHAADSLAAWVRTQGITPPADWLHDLALLRFGPPGPDATETLARLLRTAAHLR